MIADNAILSLHKSWQNSARAAVSALDVREQKLAAGSEDGSVRIWDLTTGQVLQGYMPRCFDGVPTCIRWLDSDSVAVSAGLAVYILVLDATDGPTVTNAAKACWQVSAEEINCISIMDRARVAIGDDQGQVKVLNLKSGEVQRFGATSEQDHVHICTATAFQKSTGLLISGGMDCMVKIWSVKQGKLSSEIDIAKERSTDMHSLQVVNPPYVYALACSNDAIAAGLGDGTILVARYVPSKKEYKCQFLHGHTLSVGALCFLDSTHLFSGSNDQTCRLWSLSNMECISEVNTKQKINSVTAASSQNVLVGTVTGQILEYSIGAQ